MINKNVLSSHQNALVLFIMLKERVICTYCKHLLNQNVTMEH